jgi:hypothetical protein
VDSLGALDVRVCAMRTGITVKVTAAERDRLKAVLHFTEISVLIEQYDDKLGVEFRTEVMASGGWSGASSLYTMPMRACRRLPRAGHG